MSRLGEGVETAFGRFNEVVDMNGACALAMLGIKFHNHLPAHLKLGMAQDCKDGRKRWVKGRRVQMTWEEICVMASSDRPS